LYLNGSPKKWFAVKNKSDCSFSSCCPNRTMDALAQTATTQLLTVEIEGLKLEIQSLRVDLQESQERCQWLDEEASLLLNVERLHHETDDDYKKRKVSIYNKRTYKREKQRGSAEEENKMLIAQLETLRGELIQSEDKYDKLSEVTNFTTIERLPGENNEDLRKRRQITYNQRAYMKRKKQMRVKQGVPEVRHPTSVARLPSDVPTMPGLEIILNKYLNTHPRNWPQVFKKSHDFRLLNVSYWINESGLIKESNPKRPAFTLSPSGITAFSSSSKIAPSAEVKRHFAVQFLDPNLREWCNLFEIKPSSIVQSKGLRSRAGYGLFAARPFKNGDRIGLYIGQVFDSTTFPGSKRTCYAVECFDQKKTGATRKVKQTSKPQSFISDAGYGPKDSTDNMKRPPVYMGIHYANDPNYERFLIQNAKRVTRKIGLPDYNIELGEDLVASTISNIEVGEELFLDYTGGSTTM
jgi:hypothetical protein